MHLKSLTFLVLYGHSATVHVLSNLLFDFAGCSLVLHTAHRTSNNWHPICIKVLIGFVFNVIAKVFGRHVVYFLGSQLSILLLSLAIPLFLSCHSILLLLVFLVWLILLHPRLRVNPIIVLRCLHILSLTLLIVNSSLLLVILRRYRLLLLVVLLLATWILLLILPWLRRNRLLNLLIIALHLLLLLLLSRWLWLRLIRSSNCGSFL